MSSSQGSTWTKTLNFTSSGSVVGLSNGLSGNYSMNLPSTLRSGFITNDGTGNMNWMQIATTKSNEFVSATNAYTLQGTGAYISGATYIFPCANSNTSTMTVSNTVGDVWFTLQGSTSSATIAGTTSGIDVQAAMYSSTASNLGLSAKPWTSLYCATANLAQVTSTATNVTFNSPIATTTTVPILLGTSSLSGTTSVQFQAGNGGSFTTTNFTFSSSSASTSVFTIAPTVTSSNTSTALYFTAASGVTGGLTYATNAGTQYLTLDSGSIFQAQNIALNGATTDYIQFCNSSIHRITVANNTTTFGGVTGAWNTWIVGSNPAAGSTYTAYCILSNDNTGPSLYIMPGYRGSSSGSSSYTSIALGSSTALNSGNVISFANPIELYASSSASMLMTVSVFGNGSQITFANNNAGTSTVAVLALNAKFSGVSTTTTLTFTNATGGPALQLDNGTILSLAKTQLVFGSAGASHRIVYDVSTSIGPFPSGTNSWSLGETTGVPATTTGYVFTSRYSGTSNAFYIMNNYFMANGTTATLSTTSATIGVGATVGTATTLYCANSYTVQGILSVASNSATKYINTQLTNSNVTVSTGALISFTYGNGTTSNSATTGMIYYASVGFTDTVAANVFEIVPPNAASSFSGINFAGYTATPSAATLGLVFKAGTAVTGVFSSISALLPVFTTAGVASSQSANFGSTNNCFANIYAGNSVITISDERKKTAIEDCEIGIEFVRGLRPKMYEYLNERGKKHIGFVAQDVQRLTKAMNLNALVDESEDILGLNMLDFIAILVKAIQYLDHVCIGSI